MIKVLLLIKNDVFRMGITASLKEYSPTTEITETGSWVQINALSRQSFYDLMIADICLSDIKVAGQIDGLRKILPRLKIIFLGNEDEKVIGINYIKKGADAVLSKEMNNTEFQSAFATVLSGRKYVFEGMRDLILKDFCDKDTINKLSTRESQIVQLLIKRKRTVDIYGELILAASAVSTIKSKIYKK
ncbi:response regulator [Dyadobacter diqingensis]|uniref:response regulator n=1 Tax=Dyadobacter diqingensis TaxID=2938121 RepID=UPI0020C44B61|nr:response regulator [Dyadobacter diqingensis]